MIMSTNLIERSKYVHTVLMFAVKMGTFSDLFIIKTLFTLYCYCFFLIHRFQNEIYYKIMKKSNNFTKLTLYILFNRPRK